MGCGSTNEKGESQPLSKEEPNDLGVMENKSRENQSSLTPNNPKKRPNELVKKPSSSYKKSKKEEPNDLSITENKSRENQSSSTPNNPKKRPNELVKKPSSSSKKSKKEEPNDLSIMENKSSDQSSLTPNNPKKRPNKLVKKPSLDNRDSDKTKQGSGQILDDYDNDFKWVTDGLAQNGANVAAIKIDRKFITWDSLQNFFDCNKINDETARFYLSMLAAKYKHVYIFDPMFYTWLTPKDQYNIDNVPQPVIAAGRETEKKELFFPLHNLGFHWTLLVFNKETEQFRYYDSMAGKINLLVYENISRFLLEVGLVKKKVKNEPGVEYVKEDTEQTDGYNCGVFMCQYAKQLCRGEPPYCTSEMCKELRREMLIEIKTKTLCDSSV